MMKLKDVIIFVSGAAVGGLTAALVLKDHYKHKYEKEAEEKCASYKEYVEKLKALDKDGTIITGMQTAAVAGGAAMAAASATAEEYHPGEFGREAFKEFRDYSGLYSNQVSEPDPAEKEHPTDEDDEESVVVDAEDVEEYDSRRMKLPKGKRRFDPPKIIRADEYDDYAWHDKQTLYYYVEDGVLVDESTNEPIDDVEMLIGDSLDKYGFATNEEENIYVRNFRIGVDYDIRKVFNAYYE